MKRLLLTSILVIMMSLCIFFISENNGNKFEIVSIKENKNYNNKNIKIPILMYHSINDNAPENNMVLPINMFKEQMLWLNDNDFNSLFQKKVVEIRKLITYYYNFRILILKSIY